MGNLAEGRKDSRSWDRIPTTATGKLVVQESLSGQIATVVVGDVSQGGMRLFSSGAQVDGLGVGANVSIRVILANRFIELPAPVVWVRTHRDFWSAGIEIRREVTATSTRETCEKWDGFRSGSS